MEAEQSRAQTTYKIQSPQSKSLLEIQSATGMGISNSVNILVKPDAMIYRGLVSNSDPMINYALYELAYRHAAGLFPRSISFEFKNTRCRTNSTSYQ
jgi:hypothetical protein